MLGNPCFRLMGVSAADRRFAQEKGVESGVVESDLPALRLRIVAGAELSAEVVTDEDRLAKHAVISYHPRHQRHAEDCRAKPHGHQEAFAATMIWIGEPAPGEVEPRQRGSIGQPRDPP